MAQSLCMDDTESCYDLLYEKQQKWLDLNPHSSTKPLNDPPVW